MGVARARAGEGGEGEEEEEEGEVAVEDEVEVGVDVGWRGEVGVAEAGVGAKTEEGSRAGTRYSRAPSGEDWRRMGVSTSVKSGRDARRAK